jgi:SAM-dependent methyltransferase
MQTPHTPFFPPLNLQRRGAVVSILHQFGSIRSVIDVGCGPGDLLNVLVNGSFDALFGVDIDEDALSDAERVSKPRSSDAERDSALELSLFRGSFDSLRVSGAVGAVTCVEVIEHLDKPFLDLLGPTVLGKWKPNLAIVTTPNAEFNPLLGMEKGTFRHDDHRFEWNRAEFEGYARDQAVKFGYEIAFTGVGKLEGTEDVGYCTQIAVFWRTPSLDEAALSVCGDLVGRYEYPASVSDCSNGISTDQDAMSLILKRLTELVGISDVCADCPFHNQLDCLPLTFRDLWGSPPVRRSCLTPSKLVEVLENEGRGKVRAEVRQIEDNGLIPWMNMGLRPETLRGDEIKIHCSRAWLASKIR